MTLRDVLDWLVSVYQTARADIAKLGTDPILDWPLWIVIPSALIVLFILISTLSEIRRDEEKPRSTEPQGFWERCFNSTFAFCFIFVLFTGMAVSIFSGYSDLDQWLGYVAAFNATIFGYALLLRLFKGKP